MQTWNSWPLSTAPTVGGSMPQPPTGPGYPAPGADPMATMQAYMQYYNQPAPSGYTTEQWAAAQQQNWAQWQQWQQQYQQWQAQYGAKYQDAMKQMSAGITGVPPTIQPPPLPKENSTAKPPLPPESVNLYNYSTSAPLLPHQNNLPLFPTKNTANPPLPLGPPPPLPANSNDNLPQGSKRSANTEIHTDSVKKMKNEDDELTEAERTFDAQFKQWEEQFNKWKQQNANHPDKAQYKQYEAKWTTWREKLIERRDQMRKKREAQRAKAEAEKKKNMPGGDKILNILSSTENQGLLNNLLGIGKTLGLTSTESGGVQSQPPPPIVPEPSALQQNPMQSVPPPATITAPPSAMVPDMSQNPWAMQQQQWPTPYNMPDMSMPPFSGFPQPPPVFPVNNPPPMMGAMPAPMSGFNQPPPTVNPDVNFSQPPPGFNPRSYDSSGRRDMPGPPMNSFKRDSNDQNQRNRFNDQRECDDNYGDNDQFRRDSSRGPNFGGMNQGSNMGRGDFSNDRFDKGQSFGSGERMNNDFRPDSFAPRDRFNERNFGDNRFGDDQKSNDQDRFGGNTKGPFGSNFDRGSQDRFRNDDRFNSGNDSMSGGNNRFGSDRDRFGSDRSMPGDRFGSASDRFGSASDRFGSASDRFGSASDRFGSASDRFGSASDRFGSNMNKFDSMDSNDRRDNFDSSSRNFGRNDRFDAPPELSPELKALMAKRRAASDVFKPSNTFLSAEKTESTFGSLGESFKKIAGNGPFLSRDRSGDRGGPSDRGPSFRPSPFGGPPDGGPDGKFRDDSRPHGGDAYRPDGKFRDDLRFQGPDTFRSDNKFRDDLRNQGGDTFRPENKFRDDFRSQPGNAFRPEGRFRDDLRFHGRDAFQPEGKFRDDFRPQGGDDFRSQGGDDFRPQGGDGFQSEGKFRDDLRQGGDTFRPGGKFRDDQCFQGGDAHRPKDQSRNDLRFQGGNTFRPEDRPRDAPRFQGGDTFRPEDKSHDGLSSQKEDSSQPDKLGDDLPPQGDTNSQDTPHKMPLIEQPPWVEPSVMQGPSDDAKSINKKPDPDQSSDIMILPNPEERNEEENPIVNPDAASSPIPEAVVKEPAGLPFMGENDPKPEDLNMEPPPDLPDLGPVKQTNEMPTEMPLDSKSTSGSLDRPNNFFNGSFGGPGPLPNRGPQDSREPPQGFQHSQGPPRGFPDPSGPSRGFSDSEGPARGPHDSQGPLRRPSDLQGPPRGPQDSLGPRGPHDSQGLLRGPHDLQGLPRGPNDAPFGARNIGDTNFSQRGFNDGPFGSKSNQGPFAPGNDRFRKDSGDFGPRNANLPFEPRQNEDLRGRGPNTSLGPRDLDNFPRGPNSQFSPRKDDFEQRNLPFSPRDNDNFGPRGGNSGNNSFRLNDRGDFDRGSNMGPRDLDNFGPRPNAPFDMRDRRFGSDTFMPRPFNTFGPSRGPGPNVGPGDGGPRDLMSHMDRPMNQQRGDMMNAMDGDRPDRFRDGMNPPLNKFMDDSRTPMGGPMLPRDLDRRGNFGKLDMDRGPNDSMGLGGNDPMGRGPNDFMGRGPNDPMNRRPNDPMGRGPNDPMGRGPNDPMGRGPNDPMGRGPNELMGRGPNDPMGRGPIDPMGRGPNEPMGRGPNDPMGRGPNEAMGRGPIDPMGRGPNEPMGRGPMDPMGRGPNDSMGCGPNDPMGRGPMDPMGRGPNDPMGRGPNDPMGRGPNDLMGRGQNDPMNRRPNDPMGRGPNDPMGRGPNDPMGRGPNNPMGRGPNDPMGRGLLDPMGRGLLDPMNRGLFDPMGRGPNDPMGRGPNDPMGRRPNDPMGRGPNDPMGRGPNDPMGRGPNDPMGRGPNDPMSRGPNDPMGRGPNDPMGRGPNDPMGRGPNDPMGRGPNDSMGRGPNDPMGRGPNDPMNRGPNDPMNRGPNDPMGRGPNDPIGRDLNDPMGRGSKGLLGCGPNDPMGRDLNAPMGRGSKKGLLGCAPGDPMSPLNRGDRPFMPPEDMTSGRSGPLLRGFDGPAPLKDDILDNPHDSLKHRLDHIQPGPREAPIRDFCITKQFNYNHGGGVPDEIFNEFVPSKVIDHGHVRRPMSQEYVRPAQFFDYAHGKFTHRAPDHEIFPKLDYKYWVEDEHNLREYSEGMREYEARKRHAKMLMESRMNERRRREEVGAGGGSPWDKSDSGRILGGRNYRGNRDYDHMEMRDSWDKRGQERSRERDGDMHRDDRNRSGSSKERTHEKYERSRKDTDSEFNLIDNRSRGNVSRQETTTKLPTDTSSPKDTSTGRHDDSPPKTMELGKSPNYTMVDDLLCFPGRQNRPLKIAIILRGPPGSGKSFVAKLIKDKELEQGGSAPRILSLDDYFLVEKDVETEDDSGKKVIVKEMVYEYEEAMEANYIASLSKAFKKNITDGFFNFIILDGINEKISDYEELWSFAKTKGFKVYICEMDMDDVAVCLKHNIHNRTEEEINRIIDYFEPTPSYHQKLDVASLLQDDAIQEVQMDENQESAVKGDGNEDSQDSQEDSASSMGVSKWEQMEAEDKLDRLDGLTRKNDGKPQTMEDFLQVPDYYNMEDNSGKKRVRWADLEERKEQEKMRAVGFVVGQTNWDRMMDPTKGGSALTRTKYI